MEFLCSKWLCDVKASFAGKCVIIALALSFIERMLLTDQRPVFWITAGKRGCGKTTTVMMIIEAVLGLAAIASAWSTNEEERRKAIFAYLKAGFPYILFDNIARGARLTCPHIEKACTAPHYGDRILGFSDTLAVSSASIIAKHSCFVPLKTRIPER
jgi:hypothetical protein